MARLRCARTAIVVLVITLTLRRASTEGTIRTGGSSL